MYKVYYRYRTVVEGCGCCSYSANELYVWELDSGKIIEDTDTAFTFYDEKDLLDHVVKFYNLEKDKIVVDKDSEYL